MLLTEKEAAEKWCPHARCDADGGLPAASNRSDYTTDDGPQFARCFGSRCTQWRWAPMIAPMAPRRHPLAPAYEYDVPTSPAPAPIERAGYCGLAGKPECN